jgi:hypothetical protein
MNLYIKCNDRVYVCVPFILVVFTEVHFKKYILSLQVVYSSTVYLYMNLNIYEKLFNENIEQQIRIFHRFEDNMAKWKIIQKSEKAEPPCDPLCDPLLSVAL